MILNVYITYKKLYSESILQDLIFQSNSLNTIDLFCFDEDDLIVDITDATVTFIVKENPTDKDSDAVINKIVTNLTYPTNGNTLIEIEKIECEDLIGNYVYELRIALVESGHEYILKQGNICFQRSLSGII